MKSKLIVCFFIFFLFSCKNVIKVDEIKIELKCRPTITDNPEKDVILIYHKKGDIKEITNKIFNAKKISINKVEKACIEEGVYIVTIKTDNKDLIYECQNEFWIYDNVKNVFLRCNILSDLRKLNYTNY